MKYLVIDALDHCIITEIIEDSIKDEDAPIDSISSILHDSNLNHLELDASDHDITAQIIGDPIKDKYAAVDAIASTMNVRKLM